MLKMTGDQTEAQKAALKTLSVFVVTFRACGINIQTGSAQLHTEKCMHANASCQCMQKCIAIEVRSDRS